MTTRRRMREARRRRSRRIRALLAAGVVFGVGAAGTLAAWNDSEHATATFDSGSFGIWGSIDGATFVDHAVSGTPATLNFQLAPTAMVPGTTTYALFSVKTLDDSVGGSVSLAAGTPSGALAPYLRYGVRIVPTPTCDASAYGASGDIVVAGGSALTVSGASPQTLAAAGASPVHYCFAVTLPADADNGAQGQSGAQSWTFAGTTG